jgi:glucose/arabinose dehydrogenase
MRSLLTSLVGSIALAAGLSTLHAAEPPPGGDRVRGATLFQQTCALCHATNAASATTAGQGPSLVGVVGRRAASTGDFPVSRALADSRLVWNADNLDRYLANPALAVPGTSMVIVVPGAQDRRDLIAYLHTLVGPAPAVPSSTALTASDPFDWRHARPGAARAVEVARLPGPFSSPSIRNNPAVVAPPPNATLSVPPGFTAKRFVAGLTGPRLLRVAPNGDIFISETRSNRIRVLRAADGAAEPTVNELFADGLDRPFGVAFYPEGDDPQWLYVANNNSIIRYPYRAGDLKPRAPAEVVVAKLSETTNGHSTRDVAFSQDGTRMFIALGSASNFGDGLSRKSPEEARRWDAEHGLGAAWDFEFHRANVLVTDPNGRQPLRVFAAGIRNPVGLAVNPITGDLWTSTNERDGLGDDLVPDYITRVREGGFYGWPWYYMGSNEDPRLAGQRPDLAGRVIVPDVPVQAHSAALQIAFYTATAGASLFPPEYRGDLFAAFHGSWNRASRTGYKVVRVRTRNGIPTGEYEDFLTGFVIDGREVWGRPVGVAVARDGALLVTEDGNGSVWRITYDGRPAVASSR